MTQKYGVRIDEIDMEEFGKIRYAQWLAPDYVSDEKNIKLFFYPRVETVRALKKFISPGDTVIDIGAQIGYTVLPEAIAAGEKGFVYAFEPNPVTYEILAKNASLNLNIAKIIAVNKAIMERNDKFVFHYTKDSFVNGGYAQGTIRGVGAAGMIEPIEVEGITLAKYFEETQFLLDRVSFIKIDTEGHDKTILQSIDWVIEKYRPIIQIEVFSPLNEWERKELYWTIEALKYVAFLIDAHERYVPKFIFTLDNILTINCAIDLLCIPKEKINEYR